MNNFVTYLSYFAIHFYVRSELKLGRAWVMASKIDGAVVTKHLQEYSVTSNTKEYSLRNSHEYISIDIILYSSTLTTREGNIKKAR